MPLIEQSLVPELTRYNLGQVISHFLILYTHYIGWFKERSLSSKADSTTKIFLRSQDTGERMPFSLQHLVVCPGFEGKVSAETVRIDNIEDFKPQIRLLKSLSLRPSLADAEKAFEAFADKAKTPFEAFREDLKLGDNKPDVAHLRIIGCKCFVHIEPENRERLKKLNERAWLGILLGFIGRFIYKVYNRATGKIAKTPYVIFREEDGIDQGGNIKRTLPEGAIRRKNEDFDHPPVGEVCETGAVVHRFSSPAVTIYFTNLADEGLCLSVVMSPD